MWWWFDVLLLGPLALSMIPLPAACKLHSNAVAFKTQIKKDAVARVITA